MVVICMATVLFLMVEWHIGGCGLVSNGRVAYRWLWSAWLQSCF